MPRTAQHRKAFAFHELKLDGDAAGTFSGYLAVFNNTDLGGDVIEPGAFTKTLHEAKARVAGEASPILWPILWQHDEHEPIGAFIDAHEDDHGLYVKGQLDLDTDLGRRAYSGMKRGYLRGMSIGYDALKHKWVGDTRHLQELRLWEGSAVTFPMNPAAQVTMVKSATQADKDAQEARSKKYGIGIKDDGAVTKPSKWADLSDADFGDPVNYAYPMPDKEHADDAAGRFMAPDAQAVYTAEERGIVAKRIMAKQKSYGEKPDWWPPKEGGKGANVTRLRRAAAAREGQTASKALDFTTALQLVSADDTLQDDWGDSFQAFVFAMHSVMCQAVYAPNMMMADDGSGDAFDGQSAAQDVLDQFSSHMADLVKQSLAAQFVPSLDDDGDSFLDPDGPNADDDGKGYMSARGPEAAKAGRTLSADNHAMMTKALGMIGMGHKMLTDFTKANAPDSASAADPAPRTNPGDEPPSQSDNVYDPAFAIGEMGKSASHAATAFAYPYTRRAGAPQSVAAVVTTPQANGAGTLGSAQKATTTQSGATSSQNDNDDDELSLLLSLLSVTRSTSAGAQA